MATLHLLNEQRAMMGTTVAIQVAVPDDRIGDATAALLAAWAWLDEMAARLTRFDPSSELGDLHRAAGTPFAASPMLFDCVTVALAAAARTDGLFDPTLLPHVVAAGYDQDFAQIARREIGPARHLLPATGRWREITLDAERRTITLPPGVQLDLGGIAKGWAGDVLCTTVFDSFANVLVNVGGDVRSRGGIAPGEPWALSIADPVHDVPLDGTEVVPDLARDLAVIRPGDGGLATSGANRRWWLQDGAVRHHIIDPRTGRPAQIWTLPEVARDAHTAAVLIATATALAPTAAEAEVQAKVALLRGFPHALQAVEDGWAADPAAGCALILILGSGALEPSLNLDAYFNAHINFQTVNHHAQGGGLWRLH